ncbi:Glycosyl transferase family 2 [Halopenitus persicus]|uniref:Glycosyl transferase family 2 n=1 Tax=Halopenitus persicus TaxID=1048396 RepID=A0A1H3ME96_9EURY|nr:Glycosyl transferase family 2 [Halopenitus persicus]
MPTMNEEAGIRECIESVRTAVQASGYHTEVIISDDSTDRTPEIARELGAIVVEPDQPGYGYAYRYAFERCRGDYIVIGDADTTINCIVRPVVNGAFHSPLVSVSGTDGERTLGLVNGRPAS